MNFREYTTVKDVRQRYKAIVGTADDDLILDFIREASRDINLQSNRYFAPQIATKLYNLPRPTHYASMYSWETLGAITASDLILDDDLLSLTTLTNGDSTVITSAQYTLEPSNKYPKFKIHLKTSSGVVWQMGSGGNFEQVISVAGIWGHSEDYTNSWVDTLATLSAAITSTSATSFTCTTGKLKAGWLIQIDSEWMYVSSVAVGASDTVTVVRGANGSTAATHLINAPIYYWQVDYGLEGLCRRAAVAYYNLRENPIGETLTIDGQSFSTPKDVADYIGKQVRSLGFWKAQTG